MSEGLPVVMIDNATGLIRHLRDRGKDAWLVGLGNIGRQVARRIKAFDANVIYYDPFRASLEEEAKLGVQYVSLNTLLETADIVSLHAPA